MTTAIAIEDVRREVKLLKSLSGHKHLIRYHDACEDANNVYIVMEYVFIPIYMSYNTQNIAKSLCAAFLGVYLLQPITLLNQVLKSMFGFA